MMKLLAGLAVSALFLLAGAAWYVAIPQWQLFDVRRGEPRGTFRSYATCDYVRQSMATRTIRGDVVLTDMTCVQ